MQLYKIFETMLTSERTKIILLTFAFICLAVVAALAQGPGFPDVPEDTPIDGGVTMIAAAAICYGAKKMYNKKQNK